MGPPPSSYFSSFPTAWQRSSWCRRTTAPSPATSRSNRVTTIASWDLKAVYSVCATRTPRAAAARIVTCSTSAWARIFRTPGLTMWVVGSASCAMNHRSSWRRRANFCRVPPRDQCSPGIVQDASSSVSISSSRASISPSLHSSSRCPSRWMVASTSPSRQNCTAPRQSFPMADRKSSRSPASTPWRRAIARSAASFSGTRPCRNVATLEKDGEVVRGAHVTRPGCRRGWRGWRPARRGPASGARPPVPASGRAPGRPATVARRRPRGPARPA